MKSHLIAMLALTALLLTASAPAAGFTEGTRVDPTTRKLKPGEFVWEPERAPARPVLLIVSKPEQLAYVYRNGIRIERTTVSTGMPGHETPVGVFNILEKQKKHTSTIYKGASMPLHGADDVDRHRHARGATSRPPGLARVRAAAAEIFRTALLGHGQRDDRRHRRRSLSPA